MRKKQKEKKLSFVGWFIIILMVSSVFGVMFYGFSSGQNTFNYNDYKFKVVGQRYITEINNNDVAFYFLPQEVLSINLTTDINSMLTNGQVFYIMFDPEDENMQYIDLLRFELAELGLKGITNKFFIPGITKKSEIYDIPVISCENATQFQPILYFKTGNTTEIRNENNCIYFEARYNSDIVRLRDRLIYSITGVI